MGITKGNNSLVRFRIVGKKETNNAPLLDFIRERITTYAFIDIDDTYEEFSIGWVSVTDMLDTDLAGDKALVGDFVALSLRFDERKVPAATLAKFIAKEENKVMREKEIRKLGRAMKVSIKEQVKMKLTKAVAPAPNVVDVSWNLSTDTVILYSASPRHIELIEDFFKECFGFQLMRQVPYMIAMSQADNPLFRELDLDAVLSGIALKQFS